jgi:hypothetical protein
MMASIVRRRLDYPVGAEASTNPGELPRQTPHIHWRHMADEIIINGLRYRKPTMEHVSEQDAPRLFELEERLHECVHNVASELSRIHGFHREQRYTHGVPQALASLLDSSDMAAAILAASTYLESQGFNVETKE